MSSEIHDDPAFALARALTEFVQDRAHTHLVLTGGTVATRAYTLLDDTIDWNRVDLWWGDERYVPDGHADRNDHQAREAFLRRLDVPPERVHPMPAHGSHDSMAAAADDHAAQLPERFDLVLLGIGPDGHIASLFPGHPQLDESRRRVVEVFDSPKPPPQRLSMTFPTLRATEETWFVASGGDKAQAVARALAPSGSIRETPARGVTASRWFLDAAAASELRR